MKPWEERWTFDGGQRVMSDDWAHPNLFRLIAANGSPEEWAQAGKLAAAAPDLYRALAVFLENDADVPPGQWVEREAERRRLAEIALRKARGET